MLDQDRFGHEIVLAAQELDGIILFPVCCHNGIFCMIDRVNDYFDHIPIKAVAGGFHLVLQLGRDRMSVSPGRIASLGRALIEKGVGKIFIGHCTGKQAYDALKDRLGDRLHCLTTGRA